MNMQMIHPANIQNDSKTQEIIPIEVSMFLC